MKQVFKLSLCLLVTMALIISANVVQAQVPFEIDAKSAVLLDADSGQILFSQNGDETHIPASLVKVMTLFIALDQIADGRIDLTDEVIVSENAWRMTGSQMFLEVGERVTIEELLYGVAVVSGNDATVSIAEALAGSEQLYVQWMNEKARSLGLNAQFVDVHGLSVENRISAKDMAILAREYVIKHPDALQYHQRRSFSYQPRSSAQPIVQSNRNGLLWRYEGTDGLKTGFLSQAGYNLVATAKQGERRLIAVVLGAPSEQVRENEAIRLLNYGFRNFQLVDINSVLPEDQVKVYKGQKGSVKVAAANSLITIPNGSMDNLNVEVQTEMIQAPVQIDQEVGKAVVIHNEQVIKEIPLLASEEVSRGSWFRVLLDTIALFFMSLFER